VGEIGLDHRAPYAAHRAEQARAFREQLALARALDRPVVLHVVRAHGEVLAVLKGDGVPRAGGVVHAFSGSVEVMQAYLALGLHISLAGPVAHPRSRRLHAAAAAVPAHRLLVETDAPDQPPPGVPGRNEPAVLPQVIAAVAALRGTPVAQVGAQAAANARRLFGLT
ncbi:MAG: TatD family hydrolase, partial [Myxococcales bacterium]|nr:TatD family hydrolase [Myxococcales bacterium]